MKIIAIAALSLLPVLTQANPNFEAIADAIKQSEGVWTYGIKTVPVHSEAEARRVCLNTIRHAWQDWDGTGSFINFLADRYCPRSVDAEGNRNWKRNMALILRSMNITK